MLKDGFELGTQTGHPAEEAGTHQSTWEGSSNTVGSRAAGEPPGMTQVTPECADLGSSESPTPGLPSGPALEEPQKGANQ